MDDFNLKYRGLYWHTQGLHLHLCASRWEAYPLMGNEHAAIRDVLCFCLYRAERVVHDLYIGIERDAGVFSVLCSH